MNLISIQWNQTTYSLILQITNWCFTLNKKLVAQLLCAYVRIIWLSSLTLRSWNYKLLCVIYTHPLNLWSDASCAKLQNIVCQGIYSEFTVLCSVIYTTNYFVSVHRLTLQSDASFSKLQTTTVCQRMLIRLYNLTLRSLTTVCLPIISLYNLMLCPLHYKLLYLCDYVPAYSLKNIRHLAFISF